MPTRTLKLFLTLCLGACTTHVGGEFDEEWDDIDGYDPQDEHDHDHDLIEAEGVEVLDGVNAIVSIDCTERSDTGYTRGQATPITVVTVDGKPVEKDTANAFMVMAQAAARDGISIRVISGFRTMAQQRRLYSCYTNCNCNSCNLAARPGYSKHQSGTALDLNTRNSAVLRWLNAHGGAYGFRRTVPSEPWHWVYQGGGPGGGPCASEPVGPPPPTPRGCGILNEGEYLGVDHALWSCNGRYQLVHQTDGNVVLYDTRNSNNALFATWTHGQSTEALWLQSDGNLVLYGPGGEVRWTARTNAPGESFLSVQDDGNVVVYDEYHRPLWASRGL